MDNEIAQRIFQQVMDLWITPEIEKRKLNKKISSEFKLKSAQIVFSSERALIKTRLNDEIKAIAKSRLLYFLQIQNYSLPTLIYLYF